MEGNEQSIEDLKRIRSTAKANVTRKINKLGELISGNNIQAVKETSNGLHEAVNEFQLAHKLYHEKLEDEEEKSNSSQYCAALLEEAEKHQTKIRLWLSEQQKNDIAVEICPDDSISNVGSSWSKKSKASSMRSTARAKAKAAAKKAALETKAASLQKLHELQFEELKLQQRKAEIELQAEIAIAEAERKVYEESEVEEMHSQVEKSTNWQEHSQGINYAPTSSPAIESNNPHSQSKISNLPLNDQLESSSPSKVPLIPKEWNNDQTVQNDHKRDSQHERLRDESFQMLMETQDRQNTVLRQLIEQQQEGVMALTLPQPTMQIFDGDPTSYCDFIRAFEHLVERKTTSPSARLYYLVQYTSGHVQELMKSCLVMEPSEGYIEAMRLLKERYGQNYQIASAYVNRLINGPVIKPDDGVELQKFSIQLTSCANTLKEIGSIGKLDNSENLKKIINRLPTAMRYKWRDVVDRIVEQERRDVTINDVTKFVTSRARVANHPVFGKVDRERKEKIDLEQRRPRHLGIRANGFATHGEKDNQERATKRITCPLCKQNHWLSRCERFRKQSLEERQRFVNDAKLCNNCLLTGHYVRSCAKQSFCKVPECTGKHSTFLHPKSNADVKKIDHQNKEELGESEKDPKSAHTAYVKMSVKPKVSARSSSATALAIVPVRVKTKGGSAFVETYAFLDSGSNTSFCTEALQNQLNVSGSSTNLSLTTIQGENTPVQCSLVSLVVSDLNDMNHVDLPMVYSRPSLPISPDAIGKEEDIHRWPHLKGLSLPEIDAEIGLLIGSDVPEALQPIEVRPSENGGPFATKTVFGWVLNGPLGRSKSTIPTANFVHSNDALERQFYDYCNREFNDSNYEVEPSMSQNDKRALKIMEDSIKLENGHYVIALPWTTHLQNNRTLAEQRLNSLKRRLQREPIVHEKYTAFMNDLLDKDYARKVNDKDQDSSKILWYLPHHPVLNPHKPEKVRVVFDCSAKYGNTSLNDQLLQGPDMTNTLVGVLTRFREERVAMTSDIESMFYQVRVQPSDCSALRFLWWPNGKLDEPAEEYEMKVHLFGGASSPSCSNFALKRTAEDNKTEFDPQTVETVKKNFYVDDCLKSVRSDDEAVRLASELRELLSRRGFRLTKWNSTSRKLVMSLPESERAEKIKDLNFDKLSIERVLGVQWNVSTDQFGFSIVVKDRPHTRRGILSVVSSVFDPLGLVAPFIHQAKRILQDLCRMKLDWDEPIPEKLQDRWQSWLQDLPRLEELAIDRCFKLNDEEVMSSQLHHFADASQEGYGAVTYLRIENSRGAVKCSFVMGKSRIAPMKSVTIPRMELSAAVTAVKLNNACQVELTLPIEETRFWTDSTCVLKYLKNEDKRFQTFVANRISVIRETSSLEQWHYVNTDDNPADDASRGVSAAQLHRWINGPTFLQQPISAWPQPPEDINLKIAPDDPEVRKEAAAFTCETVCSDILTTTISRCSSWSRLRRVVAWVLRYKSNLLRRVKERENSKETMQKTTIGPVTVHELREAEKEIIKHVQHVTFSEEIKVLTKEQGKASNCKAIKKSSNIYQLDPVIKNGLLRVGGRLRRAQISEEAKHPSILPKSHHVVTLIVNFYHHVSGHSGVEHTLSLIRERYWIVNGRATVKNIIGKCYSCRKRQSPVSQQKMADLPHDRVTPSKPPFTYTGVDCFGPFEVKRGRSTVKRYGVLFTCLTVRAIHIEVASSLDTESFINAFRRFVSRRGQPEEIRSDNGGNFVKGEKELRQAVNSWNQAQIHEALLQQNVKWTFNSPAGSHHGGVWERCIRTVRKVVLAILKEQQLDDESLNTLMCEVESVVNGRPITKLSDDPRDNEPLTPNHLLLLRSGSRVPPGVFCKQDGYSKRRWRQVQYMANVFWRRWLKEYLPSLQRRQKWSILQRNFVVNDVVLVLDENKPRCHWPLGRVIDVYTNSADRLVRSVKLRTSSSELVRPVDKIVLLEEAMDE